jgi:hypothetical protein
MNEIEWRRSTCGEARDLSDRGCLIFWRPDGLYNPASSNPDAEPAWYADVQLASRQLAA